MVYLSICIPTYNRCKYLCDTIESIISQDIFLATDEVEIVVSDNCSTDDTEIEVAKFVQKFPFKIKYSKNDENILDKNFEKALSLGSGLFLKLNNDTLQFLPSSLSNIITIIKQCDKNKTIPFFLNGSLKTIHNEVNCETVEELITTVSYWCTWIGAFTITQKAFNDLENFSRFSHLQLCQVDVLMRLLEKNQKVVVIPDILLNSVAIPNKGGYNLPKVFITNYFQILSPFFNSKKSLRVLKKEKKKVLINFVIPWLINIKQSSKDDKTHLNFDISNFKNVIKKEFNQITILKFNFLFLLKSIKIQINSKIKGD